MKRYKGAVAGLAMALLVLAVPAFAVPTLQLYVEGATYNLATETWVYSSPTNTFYLGAYLAPDANDGPADPFYITAALLPVQSGDLGSFTFDGNRVDATGGMTYGTPTQLPTHDVFPTYYYRYGAFTFDGAARYNPVDFNAGFTGDLSTLQANSAGDMYQRLFFVDVSTLATGSTLHFDLFTYNEGNNGGLTIEFAPFSHDAATKVPEPGTMILLGTGLVGLAVYGRRQMRP